MNGMFRKFCEGLGIRTTTLSAVTSTVLGLRGYTANLTTSLGSTAAIGYDQYAGGSILVPGTSSITSLTWYGSDSPEGTFLPAQDSTGTAVTQAVAAGKAYPIPDALFGYGALKAVVDVAGPVLVTLKS